MTKKSYAVIRTDNILSYQVGQVHHVRLQEEETQNGVPILAGDIEPDNLDVREGVKPELASTGIAVIADPVLIKDARTREEEMEYNYVMEKGHVARAYQLTERDVFSVSKEAFEGEPEAGKFVVVGEDYKWEVTDTEPDEGFYAAIVKVEPVGGRFSVVNGVEPQEYVIMDVKRN